MTTKIPIKKTNKLILDYSNNSEISAVFNFLEAHYKGMTKAEIIQMALVNLLKSNNLPIHQMTDDQEAEYAKAMKQKKTVIVLKYKKDISNYIMSI